MSEANIKQENKSKEQDPAYYAVLQDFKNYCENTLSNYSEEETTDSTERLYNVLGEKYNLNTNLPETTPLSNELILLCSELAFWIYTPNDLPIPKPFAFKDEKDNDFFHWHYKKIVETKQTQISQWAFLQFSGEPKNAYLVFKGTDPDKIFDIMADTAVIPMPIWCKEDAKNTNKKLEKNQKKRLSQQFNYNKNDSEDDINPWHFAGHSGIYATLMRDFHRICKIINHRISQFDNLYVIGHSLGGGLGILFGLETIINAFIPSNKSLNIITFGSPCVISYENNFNLLSQNAKKILYKLHNICHCFVNRFDPVPRVPTRIEWMMTVIPYALRKIVAQQVKQKMKLPNFLIPLVKSGVKSGVSKFVQYVEKYLDLLRSYHPFGTYYFYAGKDCDKPFITKNQIVIEKLLGFIPPHKIVTSDGQELRVSHYSTNKINVKHQSRFSLSHVTELTLANNQNDNNNNEKEEKKVNIIDLLMEKSKTINNQGIIYDNSELYVSVETNDDQLRDEYRSKKLSEEGWIMLVSNHLMEQYIDIFKLKLQSKKSKYPLLAPKNVMDNNHFGNNNIEEKNDIKDELSSTMYATANLLKSTSKKLWNQAKDKYQKEINEYQKRNEFENKKPSNQSEYPGLNNKNNTPIIHQQPMQYKPYNVIQQPQQQYQYYQPQYVPAQYNHNIQQQQQQQTVYIQQPINISNNQQIGNTQYRIAQHPTQSHYVVYQPPQQPQQPLQQSQQPQQPPSNSSLYPSLSKR